MCSLEKEHTHSLVQQAVLSILPGSLLKVGNLFFDSVSVIGFVHASCYSFTNFLNCSKLNLSYRVLLKYIHFVAVCVQHMGFVLPCILGGEMCIKLQ